eukprot:TRINITY_DN20952_c0_g1_i1.p1 TRINITY_DN20952_c0_g1~~TRINITY_DN20952_c0_g1_i1.p1  ORF type:complete len:260 (+),score=31.56 TRINITY_DN20952_c0_g1_i1:35-814(+)
MYNPNQPPATGRPEGGPGPGSPATVVDLPLSTAIIDEKSWTWCSEDQPPPINWAIDYSLMCAKAEVEMVEQEARRHGLPLSLKANSPLTWGFRVSPFEECEVSVLHLLEWFKSKGWKLSQASSSGTFSGKWEVKHATYVLERPVSTVMQPQQSPTPQATTASQVAMMLNQNHAPPLPLSRVPSTGAPSSAPLPNQPPPTTAVPRPQPGPGPHHTPPHAQPQPPPPQGPPQGSGPLSHIDPAIMHVGSVPPGRQAQQHPN